VGKGLLMSSLAKGLNRIVTVCIAIVALFFVTLSIPQSAHSKTVYDAAMAKANSIIGLMVVNFDNFVGKFLLTYFTLLGITLIAFLVYAKLTHKDIDWV
jgi:hypothetical protein